MPARGHALTIDHGSAGGRERPRSTSSSGSSRPCRVSRRTGLDPYRSAPLARSENGAAGPRPLSATEDIRGAVTPGSAPTSALACGLIVPTSLVTQSHAGASRRARARRPAAAATRHRRRGRSGLREHEPEADRGRDYPIVADDEVPPETAERAPYLMRRLQRGAARGAGGGGSARGRRRALRRMRSRRGGQLVAGPVDAGALGRPEGAEARQQETNGELDRVLRNPFEWPAREQPRRDDDHDGCGRA